MTEREINEVRELRSEINDLERKIELMRGALMNIVPLRNCMPQGHDLDSRVEKTVVEIGELEEELLELKERRELAQLNITANICAANLTGQEAAVIYSRYVKCMRFRDICFELNYSDYHVFRLHKAALKKMLFQSRERQDVS